jgi:hypothetical protein
MCPEPALLVAYLDRTLFSRDVVAVEEHVSGCESCASLLAAMRKAREAEAAQRRRRRVIPVLVASVAVIGIGAWAFRPGSTDTTPPAPSATASAIRSEPVQPAPIPTPTPAPPPPPVERSRADTREPERPPAAATTKPVPKPASRPAAKPTERASVPRVQWRTNDRIVERSTDGGVTWAVEYTTDRAIRASAFVNADVAWLVGENGLILRKTKNGWFGASPPAEGQLTAVRASSPSRATVTLEDGRVFTTENGGVTWSSP